MNSRFFHVKALNHRHKNRLTSLKNAMGLNLDGDLLDNHIVDNFQNLFSSNTEPGWMDFLSRIESRVDETVSANISHDFTNSEIFSALKQMYPTKALGLDGMPPLFFQNHWHIIGPSITKSLLLALNLGHFPNDLNCTFITVILKKKIQNLANYHPISLSYVLYKLMSKAIANRLKVVLPT